VACHLQTLVPTPFSDDKLVRTFATIWLLEWTNISMIPSPSRQFTYLSHKFGTQQQTCPQMVLLLMMSILGAIGFDRSHLHLVLWLRVSSSFFLPQLHECKNLSPFGLIVTSVTSYLPPINHSGPKTLGTKTSYMLLVTCHLCLTAKLTKCTVFEKWMY